MTGVREPIIDLRSFKNLKSRDLMNILFWTVALCKALKINLLYSKKVDGQAFRSAEVKKSATKISYGLDLKLKSLKRMIS